MYSSVIPVANQILMTITHYSQFALRLVVLATLVLLGTRMILKAQEQISVDLIEKFNKLILGLSSIVLLVYLIELIIIFSQWSEHYEYYKSFMGPYWISYILMLFLSIIPQLFWKRKLRRNLGFTLIVAVLLLINLYMESGIIFLIKLLRNNL